MNPTEKKEFAGYILILVAIGNFIGFLALSFVTYRMLTFQIIVPSDIPSKISRAIFFVGLVIALINFCIGLFLIKKYHRA